MVVSTHTFDYVRHMPTTKDEVTDTSVTPHRVSYSPEEFAQITGMKPNSVRRAIRDGEIKATKIGRLWWISRLEVERLFGAAA